MLTNKEKQFDHLLDKAKAYCAYQERCTSDIKKKLYEWRASADTTSLLIDRLISEDYIDEKRFAKLFTGSKFRIKKWGRNKIIAALRSKGITDRIIEISLEEINERDYHDTLKMLIEKKRSEMKDTDPGVIRNKVINFARSRGFELELIYKYV